MTEIEREMMIDARNRIRDFGPATGSVWIESQTGNAVQIISCAIRVGTLKPFVVFSDYDQAWVLDLDEWLWEVPGPDLSPVRRFVPAK